MRKALGVSIALLCLICLPIEAQEKGRRIWLRLKSEHVLTGDLVKMDPSSIDFTVKGILQSVPCDDLIEVMFIPPNIRPSTVSSPAPTSPPDLTHAERPEPMTATVRPTILYREKASYTEKAARNRVEGTIILQVTFNTNGNITDIKVVRGLPDGLSDRAIETAKNIRFIPAIKDGKYISVRGSLEFTFKLH